MPWDEGIFSKRKRDQETSKRPQLYQYENLPDTFRVQVYHILKDAIPILHNQDEYFKIWTDVWHLIYDTICREHGLLYLNDRNETEVSQCINYLLNPKVETEQILDFIEYAFKIMERVAGKIDTAIDTDKAVKELNYRFKEHSIGYMFVEGRIIRMDSQYIYTEIIESAITLLVNNSFQGALDEFMLAHKLYTKNQTNKDAIVNANKAFESTMKTICIKRKWMYKPDTTIKNPNPQAEAVDKLEASKLIKTLFDNGLIPSYLQTQFGSLRGLLEFGIPPIRNQNGGHGQGEIINNVPNYLVAYAMHLAATNIVFLIEADTNLPK